MDFQEMIEHLANTMPINKKKALDAGGVTLTFQDKLELNLELEKDQSTICLYSKVIDLPEENRVQLYTHLLRTHLFGAATEGAFFGIHRAHREILLFKRVATHTLDKDNLLSILAQFAAQAQLWSKTLARERADYSV